MKIKKLTLLVLACAFLVNQYSYAMQSKVTSVKKARTVSTRAKRYMALMDEIERELNTGNVVPRNIINDTKEIIKKYTYRYKANLIDIAERALRTGPTTRPIPPTPPTPPIPPTKRTYFYDEDARLFYEDAEGKVHRAKDDDRPLTQTTETPPAPRRPVPQRPTPAVPPQPPVPPRPSKKRTPEEQRKIYEDIDRLIEKGRG